MEAHLALLLQNREFRYKNPVRAHEILRPDRLYIGEQIRIQQQNPIGYLSLVPSGLEPQVLPGVEHEHRADEADRCPIRVSTSEIKYYIFLLNNVLLNNVLLSQRALNQ